MTNEVSKIQITNINSINNNTNQNATFRGTTDPIPNDTVEISKKKGISNNAKIAIGLGVIGTIVGGILIHKHFSKHELKEAFNSVEKIDKRFAELEQKLPEVQQKFKEAFLRNDLTEEQTKEILNGYKEVEKLGLTSSKEEYVKALFEQAKKNYQIYNPKMTVDFKSRNNLDVSCGFCTHANETIHITPKGLQESRSRLFEIIHHELRHAKQNECLYHCYPKGTVKGEIYHDYLLNKYPDIDEFIEISKEIAKEAGTGNYYKKEWQDVANKKFNIEKVIEERFGKPDPSKVPDEYKKTLEQINFETSTTIHYPYRMEEKDAFKIGNMMRELILGIKGN